MASELKPCPFCAGSNLETYYADIEGWIAHIKCIDCDDMIGPMSEFKYETQEEAYEDASKRWNTRPPPLLPYRRMLPASAGSWCAIARKHGARNLDITHMSCLTLMANMSASIRLWSYWRRRRRQP